MAPASTTATSNATSASNLTSLLNSLQEDNRHVFLQPPATLPTESLNIVKNTLEDIVSQVSEQQQQRLKEDRKRKRGSRKIDADEVLKLRKIYVDGFETNQVWQQAKKVIEGVLRHSETVIDDLVANNEIIDENSSDNDSEAEIEEGSDAEEEVGSDVEEEEEDLEQPDEELDLEEQSMEDLENENEDVEAGEEEDEEDEEEDDSQSYTEDPDGLNDGFFSLDDFNKQTQWFEEQDARGDPNTDHVSDEEDIDWDADPSAPKAKDSGSRAKASGGDDDDEVEEEEDEEDDGPTFGDMALDAPEGESEDEEMLDDIEEEEAENNANDIFYKDFFAPPPRKSKGDRPKKKVQFQPEEPAEEDINRAMDDVRRDLFDDESDMENSDDALSDVSAGDPRSRRSAHERRQAKLAEEIRQLEAASVAKREWTLSGEATAVDRPTNSLLEQDLDFEYVGKPVPVITPEVSESIEDLIKRRILAQEFDEVLRRRPETESVPSGTRRGLVEVSDTKSNKGLAEIYEEEHVKNTNPDTYVSQSDEKLQREEKEIENMWKEVSSRLDSLSSWHYKPKPVAASLSVVADVGTVSMEDAQPTTAQGVVGESSRMAPQEVYKAGADNAAQGEVVAKSGLPVARQEMSREDRTRRRRRQKERIRKAGGTGADGAGAGQSKKAQTIADLKKGGVKVINRKGEITDVDGNKVKAAKAASSGSYKL